MVAERCRWFVLHKKGCYDIWYKPQYGCLCSTNGRTVALLVGIQAPVLMFLSRPRQHYNAVCHLYIHEAPWCEGEGTPQSGVQTGQDQLPSQDQGIEHHSSHLGPFFFSSFIITPLDTDLFLINHRKASRRRRKERRKRRRNPDSQASSALSVGQAA